MHLTVRDMPRIAVYRKVCLRQTSYLKGSCFIGKTSYELSLETSVEVVALCDGIRGHREQVSQILRSSSLVSANLSEARYAESTADFVHKVKIARKECFETETWLSLMRDGGIISESAYKPLNNKYGRIRRMLTAAINTINTKNKPE